MNLSNLPLERVAKGALSVYFPAYSRGVLPHLLPRRRDVPPEGARHVLMVRRPGPCRGALPLGTPGRGAASALPAREQRSLTRHKRFLPRRCRGRKPLRGIKESPFTGIPETQGQKNLLSTNLGASSSPTPPNGGYSPQWIAAAPVSHTKSRFSGKRPLLAVMLGKGKCAGFCTSRFHREHIDGFIVKGGYPLVGQTFRIHKFRCLSHSTWTDSGI